MTVMGNTNWDGISISTLYVFDILHIFLLSEVFQEKLK